MNQKGVVFVSTFHESEAHSGRNKTRWIAGGVILAIVVAVILVLALTGGGGGGGAPGY